MHTYERARKSESRNKGRKQGKEMNFHRDILLSIGTMCFVFLFKGTSEMIWQRLSRFFVRFYQRMDRIEIFFLEMNNISTITNQIIFLMLADRIFMPEHKLTCLYTLMFYNVIAYCISYVKELIEKEDWSPYVTLTERSKIRHLAMSATKIVLEWTKAVTFVVTLTFLLLVFALEQGLQHYK